MQFTFETQGSNTFLVYEMGELEQLDSMTMGMVGNNKLEGVIPFQYTQMDKQRLLKYNVSSRVSLAQYLSGIVNKKRLIGVMESLATAVLNAQEYMLEANSFVWDKDYIFVDVSTAKAELVCVPVMKQEKPVELELVFKDMFFGIQFDQTENCDYIAKLLSFFNANTHFSLQDFLKLVKELDTQEPVKPATGMNSATMPASNPASMNSTGVNSAVVSAPAAAQAAVPMQQAPQPMQNRPSQNQPVVQQSGKKAKPQKAPKEKKEKKGFSLFGKKDKKPATNVSTSLPGRSTGTVPNMPGTAANVGNFVSNQVPPVATPQQSIPQQKQGIGNAYVSPAYNTQQASFGGTVVLNAANNPGTVVLSQANNPANIKPMPYLVRVSNGQRIPLNKVVTKIGSDASYADVVIADNKAVSRSHADIRLREDKVFLVDNNSTNHSYVGDRMLQPNVEENLSNGSTFKLANEEFKLHIS